MQIFSFTDDIQVIREFLKENSGIRSVKSKLAEAAGCQLSYLSQALAGKVFLTPDHAFGISKFLRLNEVEAEYFMLLVQVKRAGAREHRSYLQSKLAEIRKTKFKVEAAIKPSGKLTDSELQRYGHVRQMSDWSRR